MTLYEWLLYFLATMASSPADAAQEHPRAAAACQAAYAAMAVDAAPPAPTPKPGECCGDCKGTGYITHGDGHRTPCPCPASCKCKGGKGCPDGQCVPGASPASASPAVPAGRR